MDKVLTLGDIATHLGIEVRGDASVQITGIAAIHEARRGHLTFLFSSTYRDHLSATGASAIVLSSRDAQRCPLPMLITPDPRLAWAKISHLFDTTPAPERTVHPSAVVSQKAWLGTDVSIGPNSVIDENVELHDDVVIGSGCFVGKGTIIGKRTRLFANVTLYHDVDIGTDGLIHSGVVIGGDGFGFAFDRAIKQMVKIAQVYGVKIGDNVEIGAGTTIDRGALNDTVIGHGVKLDNQVQVGHNTTIGDHTVISGCTAIAGSTKIGSYCLIGGAVGIIDNLEITDEVEITAMTLVSRSITKPGRYSSGTGLLPSNAWKRSVVGFSKLDQLIKRIRELEKRNKER